jgi:hypothetical protein
MELSRRPSVPRGRRSYNGTDAGTSSIPTRVLTRDI